MPSDNTSLISGSVSQVPADATCCLVAAIILLAAIFVFGYLWWKLKR